MFCIIYISLQNKGWKFIKECPWVQHLRKGGEETNRRRSLAVVQVQWQPWATTWRLWRWNCPLGLSWVGWDGQVFTLLHWSVTECGLGGKGVTLDKGISTAKADPKGLTTEGPSANSSLSGWGNKLFTEEGTGRRITASTPYAPQPTGLQPQLPIQGTSYPSTPSTLAHLAMTQQLSGSSWLWETGQNHCVPAPWLASCSEWDDHFRPECQYQLGFGHYMLLRKYSSVTCWDLLGHWPQLG